MLKYIAFQNGVILKNFSLKKQSVKRLGYLDLLCGSSKLSVYFFIMACCWLTASFLSYSLQYIVLNIEGNPFWNFIIMAQIPHLIHVFLCYVLVDLLGRRLTLSLSFAITSVSMFVIVTMHRLQYEAAHMANISLFIMAKLGANLSFSVVYLMTTELFPTALRQQSLSACSMIARIGSILGPMLGFLNNIFPDLTMIVMLSIGLIMMGLSLILPETKGRPLPDGVEDVVTTLELKENSENEPFLSS